MSVLFLDSGAGADANPIGGNWSTLSGLNPLQRLSNKFANVNANTDSCAYVNSVTPPNDQYCVGTVDTAGAAPDGGVAIRCATSAQSCYFTTNYDVPNIRLLAVVAGSFSELDFDAGSYVDGQTVYIEAVGTTIASKVNNVAKNSVTDASLTSGRFGMFLYDPDLRITNFEGGDFLTAAGFNIAKCYKSPNPLLRM